ncbi:hypothetical protein [Nocardioides xinjiangensis]|uniref:hypothetical protein n=1 Tax=Nocardioides xinjiangensis TaxID=2817376 RepID=UPI001B3046D6|nr:MULTISPECIES: hypothetical protein [unclassified Nocardioides]
MVPTPTTVARARVAFVLALVGLGSLVAAVSLAPSTTTQSVVVLTALAAHAALTRVPGLIAVPPSGRPSLRPPRRAADVPLVLAGRTTDVVHHPVRPRAPGRI